MTMPDGNTPGATFPDVLPIALEMAVPLHIGRLRHVDAARRMAEAADAATVIGSHGDDLQYGGKHCADAFNALARGLAIGAYQPGGITFAGMHWCTTIHEGCPQARPTAGKR
ncbi:hypothetical protein [Krasilnikovia sp. MM14-A1259]|uniref:hypothetical protein n=1 Tax=Krasilnikovia sp. MM14-A1259 TaxID=3373539 RepID=UPI003804A0AA